MLVFGIGGQFPQLGLTGHIVLIAELDINVLIAAALLENVDFAIGFHFQAQGCGGVIKPSLPGAKQH